MRENVEVAGVALGLSRRVAAREALELLAWLGIGDKANTLAGGLPYTDERRVGIARALVSEPQFVLLDEPAVNRRSIGTPDRHSKGTPSVCVSDD